MKTSNADFSRHSVVLGIKKPPPLVDWSLIVGDCIHNLRSALDHLVYAIAVYEEGTNPPSVARKIQFPIADTASAFGKQSHRIQTLTIKVRTAIEGVQPFNRPHAELPPLLTLVREMDDANKHRLLQLAIAAFQQGHLKDVKVPLGTKIQPFARIGSFEDGAEVIGFTVDPPTPHVDFDYELFVTVCLGHPSGAAKRSFTEVVPYPGMDD